VTAVRLRAVPTLTGGLLGIAFGSLALSGICANRVEPSGIEILPFAAGLWVFVAASVFAANEGWRGPSTSEWVRVFGRCLAIALLMLLLPVLLLTVAVNVLEALGGHL
jgi:hypothetical protein